MAESKIKVGIFGGSGYGGAELLRILLQHPQAEIVLVTAHEHAGKAVSEVHRNLYGITDLQFTKADFSALPEMDFAFFALPHGQALQLVPQMPQNVKIIDLSGDFRLADADVFEQFYKLKHTATALQKQFVYGLTETNREAIKNAHYIANPGCFATATLLGLAPLVTQDALVGRVIVDAKTGSSGSGIKPAEATLHPRRVNSFHGYKPFTHQHVPEIEQHLQQFGNWAHDFVFMTYSLPLVRGIFASIYVETENAMTLDSLTELYANFYRESFFVRLVKGSPDVNWVKLTNFCDIGLAVNGKQVVVFSAIDNLVKGAAGQAVQNMNLMAGLDEKTGLLNGGSNP